MEQTTEQHHLRKIIRFTGRLALKPTQQVDGKFNLTRPLFQVLYLAVSPDGESIVTGAGDETLRFWNVFSKVRSTRETKSVLNLFTGLR